MPKFLLDFTRQFSRRAAIAVAVACLSTVIAILCSSTFSSFGKPRNLSPVIAQAIATPTCCGQDFDKPHLLAASYYSVVKDLVATLMLNNKGPEPIEVKPTLFSLTGERLEAALVVVPGQSFRIIDLRDLGAVPGTLFEQGSIQLFHRGPDLVIGAQLYLVDESHSLSFDEKFAEFQNAASTQLEAVWWVPSRNSDVTLILSNTSAFAIDADATVNAGTPHPKHVSLTLSPHETHVIKVERQSSGVGGANDVGTASIHHAGANGSLLARALVSDSNAGYSMSAQFNWPQSARSSAYQGVGVRLSTAEDDSLVPIVVARNVADVPTSLVGRMPYTTVDGDPAVVELPPVRLAAGEARRIILKNQLSKRRAHTASLSRASSLNIQPPLALS
jgi:hypothetical protein